MGHLDRGLSGQTAREQAVLEGEGRGPLPGEAAGVVHADGGAAGEFLREDGVVRAVVVRVGHADADRDAQGGAAGPERHREHGVDALPVAAAPGRARVAFGEPPDDLRVVGPAEHRAALAQGAGGRQGRLVDVLLADGQRRPGVAGPGGAVGDPAHLGTAVREGRRLLRAEHPVEQVDAGEVGVPGDEQSDQFLGGADDVQGGADAR